MRGPAMERLAASILQVAFGLLLAHPLAAAESGALCRMECSAQFAEHAQNLISVQTCLTRCAARAAAMGSANVTAATVMAQPRTPGSGGGAPQVEAKRFMERPDPRHRPASTPASFGAIHIAPAPSRSYGLVVGAGDRVSAHRAAETACIGAAGATCRPAGDFTDRCAAVGHALRAGPALVMTAHPSTFTVTAATIGTGPTREDAERQAVASCARVGRGRTCRITETRCAG